MSASSALERRSCAAPWTGNVRTSARTITVGMGYDREAEGYRGLLDDLLVWNRPLSDAEIAQVYRATGGR